jgi:hypothetical protein
MTQSAIHAAKKPMLIAFSHTKFVLMLNNLATNIQIIQEKLLILHPVLGLFMKIVWIR